MKASCFIIVVYESDDKYFPWNNNFSLKSAKWEIDLPIPKNFERVLYFRVKRCLNHFKGKVIRQLFNYFKVQGFRCITDIIKSTSFKVCGQFENLDLSVLLY